ncbi:MAG: hypothetical protein L0Y76_04850 [Ignavibacteria bacterium]|nr:hypothetical protein [Ignavibacteria bacterium]
MPKNKNIISEIYNKKAAKRGMIKKEAELADEFEKFAGKRKVPERTENEIYKPVSYLFIYQKLNLDVFEPEKQALKLAAASKHDKSGDSAKDFFYINSDLNSALRIKVKKSKEVSASLISSPHLEFKNPLVYCRETDKYYLPDAKEKFNLGMFDDFHPDNFHFEILLSVIKVDLVDTEGTYIPFHNHAGFEIKEIKTKDGNLVVKISKEVPHKAAVIISGSFRDFAVVSGNSLSISRALLSEKMSLLFY